MWLGAINEMRRRHYIPYLHCVSTLLHEYLSDCDSCEGLFSWRSIRYASARRYLTREDVRISPDEPGDVHAGGNTSEQPADRGNVTGVGIADRRFVIQRFPLIFAQVDVPVL